MWTEEPRPQIERPTGPRPGMATAATDHVIDLLRALGYRYLPLTPGSSFRGLHDSVVNYGGNCDPQLLLCLHEEIAVSLAHGYAKAMGRPAAVAVHDLVGLMHASMAVYDAYADRVPLLIMGGSGPSDAARRRPIDWTHSAHAQAELVRQFVKWDDEPATASNFAASLLRGHQIAASAPAGPVYIALDAALQEEDTGPPPAAEISLHAPQPPLSADEEAADAAARLLAGARFPVVVGGRVGRDSRATGLLTALVEGLGAAYVDDAHVVAFPTDHPQNAGDRSVISEADVVLAVDLPNVAGTMGWLRMRSPGTGPAVIDLSYGDLGLRSWANVFSAPQPRTVQLLADPLRGLQSLTGALPRHVRAAHRDDVLARVRSHVGALRQSRAARQAAAWDSSPISPARLVGELWTAVRDLEWLLVLRNTRSWPEGIWRFQGAGQYLGHSGGGGVGYGPGAMVGGALAARDRGQLGVAIVGDGDLLMASGALWTAAHYRIPMLVVVNDNQSFYNDDEHQARVARARGRPAENAWIGTAITDPSVDIAALARSYGCWAVGPVMEADKLAPALQHAVKEALGGAVAVVHVRTGHP